MRNVLWADTGQFNAWCRQCQLWVTPDKKMTHSLEPRLAVRLAIKRQSRTQSARAFSGSERSGTAYSHQIVVFMSHYLAFRVRF